MSQSVKYGLSGLYLLLIVIVSYSYYPGASICEEDTQIYLPLLLKAQNASLLKNDLITQHPHTAFTLFDELVLFVSGIFRLSLPWALTVLLLISRCLLCASFFVLFRILGCVREVALALASLMMLGGAIPGAQILIVEFEPVPRGFAFALTFAGIAMLARERILEGTFLGCLAFLLHPTATLPFWIGWVTVLRSDGRKFSSNQRLRAAVLSIAATLLLTIVALGSSPAEQSRHFLGFIDAQWEALLKLRTPYVFVSEWSRCDFCLLSGAGLMLWLAWWRCRPVHSWLLRRFVFATVIWSLIMLPASWLLLDQFKLAIFPQLQPARALIFMVAFMLVFSWTAAWKGLMANPFRLESHLWVLSSLFFALDRTLVLLLWPLLSCEVLKNSFLERHPSDHSSCWIRRCSQLTQLLFLALVAATRPCGLELLSWATAREVGFVLILSLGLGVVLARRSVSARLAYPLLLILIVLLFPALPHVFRKPASTPDRSQIRDLADWAKSATPVNAVFLFLDAGHDKSPGVFRFYANRAVYVDWKSGGQVNFSRSFAMEWGKRRESTLESAASRTEIQELGEKGIDYVVTQKPHSILNREPVYETRTFCVYRTH